MRNKILITLLVIIFLSISIYAQEPIRTYLPIIFSEGNEMPQNYPILAINSESGERINLLDEGSGLVLADPYWQPNITQLKGGGTFVNAQTADGRALVNAQYDNVIETIPLRITGESGWITIRNLRRMFNVSVNAQSYWTQIFEQDKVWLEIRADCDNHLTGYSSIYTISIPNITSPYTRPFANPIDKSQFDTINIVIEREPFWSPLEPGEIIGPLYNLIKNSDFELWNFGIADSQPDSWDNLETVSIIGTNNRTQSDVKWGQSALEIAVTGSTAIGEAKGVTQVLESVTNNTTYTILAWVKNDGISAGVGRILITYSDQLELYRDDDIHGWQLYSGAITTGVGDTVGVSVEILSTANNTLGTFYVDGLMLIEGDWTQEASDNLIGYMTGSNIVNHSDDEAGDINFVDMWNLPGDVDSLIKLELINNNSDTSNINYNQVRIGLRRTGDINLFDNVHDPIGLTDTDSSGDDSLSLSLNADWEDITTKIIQTAENTSQNLGRFKVYARIRDDKESGDSDLDSRLFYFSGSDTNKKFLDLDTSPIVNNWAIVDLTDKEPINLDLKFNENPPSQIGYTLQMKRDTADTAKFDYFIIMPTDGGFIDINFDDDILIPLTKLVVDNTQKLTVQGNDTPIGYVTVYTLSKPLAFYDFEEFLGSVYSVFGDTASAQASVHRNRNGRWSEIFNPGTHKTFESLEVFNGELYTGSSSFIAGGTTLPIYKTDDGVNWSVAFDSLATFGDIFAYFYFKSYKGYLWVSYFDFTANDHRLGRWDGTTFTRDLLVMGGPGNAINTIEIYNNKLYLGTSVPSIIEYDVDTGANAVVHIPPDDIGQSTVFDNRLFMTTSASNNVVSFDGNSWTDTPIAGTTFLNGIDSLNDNLYVSGTISAFVADGAILYVSEDGINWEKAYDEEVNYIWRIKTKLGILHISVFDNTIANIKTLTDTETFYSITNYEGGGFSAPPRTLQSDSRHRYFFSYDRENFVNNIDDKALIGIGYRPRYFSLINVDEF